MTRLHGGWGLVKSHPYISCDVDILYNYYALWFEFGKKSRTGMRPRIHEIIILSLYYVTWDPKFVICHKWTATHHRYFGETFVPDQQLI